MVIQLPEWDGWRIAGGDLAWEVQVQAKKGKSAGSWSPTNYFSTFDAAMGYAYERTLRECGAGHVVDMTREALVACERTKSSLLKAFKAASR